MAMLLWDHEAAPRDGAAELNTARLARVCGEDWGLYTTVTDNLAACADLLGELVPGPPDRAQDGGLAHAGAGGPPDPLVPGAGGGRAVTRSACYASDIHASDVCWRKFLNAARFYGADTLVMDGDVSGKAVIPIVPAPGGSLVRQMTGDRVLARAELDQIETGIRDMGFYPFHTTDEELDQTWATPRPCTGCSST